MSRYFKLALVTENGDPVPFHMIANDGNTEDGDGCSAICTDELASSAQPAPLCGDGVLDLASQDTGVSLHVSASDPSAPAPSPWCIRTKG